MIRSALLIWVLLSVCVEPARAHDRSTSYSTVRLGLDSVLLQLKFRVQDYAALDQTSEEAEWRALLQGIYVAPCAPERRSFRSSRAHAGWVERSIAFKCPKQPSEYQILMDPFGKVVSGHLHFARIDAGGGVAHEHVFSAGDAAWTVSAETREASVWSYMALGSEHILTGYDHLAFVLALVLGVYSLRQLAAIVTGFTMGHSTTLALATLGHIKPISTAVEALIGLSILVIAVENAWSSHRRVDLWTPSLALAAVLALAAAASTAMWIPVVGAALFVGCYFAWLRAARDTALARAAVASLFGLIHGFGFAGVLTEAKLAPAHMVHALFGFNVGVELGQLLALGMLVMLRGALLRQEPNLSVRVVGITNAAVAALGTYWFVARMWH